MNRFQPSPTALAILLHKIEAHSYYLQHPPHLEVYQDVNGQTLHTLQSQTSHKFIIYASPMLRVTYWIPFSIFFVKKQCELSMLNTFVCCFFFFGSMRRVSGHNWLLLQIKNFPNPLISFEKDKLTVWPLLNNPKCLSNEME